MQLFFLDHLDQFLELINAYLLLLHKAGYELHVGSAKEPVHALLVYLLGIFLAAYGRLIKKEPRTKFTVGYHPVAL